jgi:exopolysaccharide biosynthesis polyprenyl glycosylphosphotransferase
MIPERIEAVPAEPAGQPFAIPPSVRPLRAWLWLPGAAVLELLSLRTGVANAIACAMILLGGLLLFSLVLPRAWGAVRSSVSISRVVRASRVLGDVGAILFGLAVAAQTQNHLASSALSGIVRPPTGVGVFGLIVVMTWLALFASLDLYDSRRLTHAFDEFKLVLQGVAMGTVAAVFIAFLLKVWTQRSWVLTTWFTCTVTVLLTRMAYRRILRGLRLSGAVVTRMLIVGAGREGRDLWRNLTRTAPYLGYKVVGFLDESPHQHKKLSPNLPPILGDPSQVRDAVKAHEVEAVLVAGGSVATETAERVYRDLQGLDVDLHLSTGLLGIASNRVAVQRFGDAPVLGLRRVDFTGFQQTLKRLFDIVVASVALALLSPVLLACTLAVRLSGPGPILFRQRRVGRDGQEFTMHKFRSMIADAETRLELLQQHNESDGLLFKLQEDPRVTRVGRVLRAWSLDELPQLLDVIRGDMSLVGPRPPLPSEVANYDPWVRNRLRVKPGLTGLWQVSGRHRLSFEDYVRHDMFYVENWSLAMDLFIVLRTIPAVLKRTGA